MSTSRAEPCKVIIPLYDFYNQAEKPFSFHDGRYKLLPFRFDADLVKHAFFSDEDRGHISDAKWVFVVEEAEKFNYREEINLLLLAFRLAKKCRVFIKFKLSPNCRAKIKRLNDTVQFTLKDDTTTVVSERDLERANELFIELLKMRECGVRPFNSVHFLYKAYHSYSWLDAFIYYMMCLESLFSKEQKGESEHALCLRLSIFLHSNMGTKYSDIQPFYQIRSMAVHGAIDLKNENPPRDNLRTLQKLEDMVTEVFRIILDTRLYEVYRDPVAKEAYFNEESRLKSYLVRQQSQSTEHAQPEQERL